MYKTDKNLMSQMETEIQQYLNDTVSISENYDFSQAKLIRRIHLFENHIYPTGKFDKQGNYKYWFDIITPRVDSEVKNIDFDTKDITIHSDKKIDDATSVIANLRLQEYLRDTGQAEEINNSIEEGSGWGNVVWKKVKEGYERVDLRNFYVINQTARTLDESPTIERHQLSQSDLRAKADTWENVEEVIEGCKSETYQSTIETTSKSTTIPYYDIYERNGEICLADLKEYQGKDPEEGDEYVYILGKIICAGTKGTTGGVELKYTLFADKISKMPFKEYHRSRYKGRWWREGLYELLFDLQVRANQIGNQLAQGLEYASKKVFRAKDRLIVNNILTDIRNGDIIRSEDLQSIDMRMDGFDQLANEFNRILSLADGVSNSREVVQGITPTSGTPLGTTQLLNQNAGKLFDFIREKLAIPFTEIFDEWTLPDMVKEIKMKDVLRLTGDSEMLTRLNMTIVESWYVRNLIALGPHSPEQAQQLKQTKLQELSQRKEIRVKGLKKMFEDFKGRAVVVITGENVRTDADLQTMSSFIQLEGDPVRRSAMIEQAMRKKGIDVAGLPKSPPQPQPQPQQQKQLQVAQ